MCNRINKIVSLLLCVSMIVGAVALLSSCEKTQEQDQFPKEKMTLIVENGVTSYKLIRAEKATHDEVDSATTIKDALAENLNCNIELESDFVKAGEEADNDLQEILVGNTNRSQTKEVLDTLEPNSWAVVNKGNKIVLCANNAALLPSAVFWFVDKYVIGGNGKMEIPENLDYRESFGNGLPIAIN